MEPQPQESPKRRRSPRREEQEPNKEGADRNADHNKLEMDKEEQVTIKANNPKSSYPDREGPYKGITQKKSGTPKREVQEPNSEGPNR